MFSRIYEKVSGFFKKQVEIEDPSIAVVFNIADHESLVAATLTHLVHLWKGARSEMVDLRDPLPIVDKYIWVGTGDNKKFLEGHRQFEKNRAFLRYLLARSISVKEMGGSDIDPSVTLIGQAYRMLEELEGLDLEEWVRPVFMKLSTLSRTWTKSEAELEDLGVYSSVLSLCHSHYRGHILRLTDIETCFSSGKDKEQDYLDIQKRVARSISKKSSNVQVQGRTVLYFSDLGEEVYSMIRRMCLSKRDFLHVSNGTYGNVVYSSLGSSHSPEIIGMST